MHFMTRSVPASAFAAWATQAKGQGLMLDAAAYAALTRQSVVKQPFRYGAVQPGLFTMIATQKIAPAAGPHIGRGGPKTVSPRSKS